MPQSHRLHFEFPEFKAQIHNLKISNAHFKKLFESYDNLTDEIERAEDGIENISDLDLEKLKKQRINLKDELYKMLKAA